MVAVNSDESIRRLKGARRPINPLAERLHGLAALDCVDFLIPFDEDLPHAVISEVRPNVFVKEGDYTRDDLSEAELVESLGGEIRILPYVTGCSTTGMIERICRIGGVSRPKRPRVAKEHA